MEEKKNIKKTNNSSKKAATNKKTVAPKTNSKNTKEAKKTSSKKVTTSSKKVVSNTKKITSKPKDNTKNKNVKTNDEVTKVDVRKNKVDTHTISKEPVKKQVKVDVRMNSKKDKSSTISNGMDGTDEIRKLLIIIGAVCAIMLAFYFITEVVIKNRSKKDNNPKVKIQSDIQYEQILMGSIFNQQEAEYYVLAYIVDDQLVDIYNQYISSYNKKDGHLKVYKVNLSEDFNKTYISEESNINSDINSIKVTGTTLIKISNKQVSESYEGYEAIKNKFRELVG